MRGARDRLSLHGRQLTPDDLVLQLADIWGRRIVKFYELKNVVNWRFVLQNIISNLTPVFPMTHKNIDGKI